MAHKLGHSASNLPQKPPVLRCQNGTGDGPRLPRSASPRRWRATSNTNLGMIAQRQRRGALVCAYVRIVGGVQGRRACVPRSTRRGNKRDRHPHRRQDHLYPLRGRYSLPRSPQRRPGVDEGPRPIPLAWSAALLAQAQRPAAAVAKRVCLDWMWRRRSIDQSIGGTPARALGSGTDGSPRN